MTSPFYIEAEFSWFELRGPTGDYRHTYNNFYRPNRITQIIVCAALKNSATTLVEFAQEYYGGWDSMLNAYVKHKHVQAAVRIT